MEKGHRALHCPPKVQKGILRWSREKGDNNHCGKPGH